MENNTQGQSWLDKLDNTIKENSKLSLLLLMQFVMMSILVLGYMKLIDKIQVKVELPTVVKEKGIVIIGKEYANDTFFQMWGREDVEIISKFNQRSIKKAISYLKNRMYPPYFYKYKELFQNYEKQVSNDLVSQQFTFAKENITVKVKEKGKKASVIIEGFYTKSIDDDIVIEAQPCLYHLNYIIQGGHIYVSSFKTTCK